MEALANSWPWHVSLQRNSKNILLKHSPFDQNKKTFGEHVPNRKFSLILSVVVKSFRATDIPITSPLGF